MIGNFLDYIVKIIISSNTAFQKMIKEEKITLIIQVNGKVRDKVEVEAGISEKEARALAISLKKVNNWLAGKEIKKVIFVPDKLINIVV